MLVRDAFVCRAAADDDVVVGAKPCSRVREATVVAWITRAMLVEEGHIERGALGPPVIYPRIAYERPAGGEDDVAAWTLRGCVEVMEPRYGGSPSTRLDAVAGNCGSSLFVLGPRSATSLEGTDTLSTSLSAGNSRRDAATVLANTAEAVGRLAAAAGSPPNGSCDLLLSPVIADPLPLGDSEELRADFGPLGVVTVSIDSRTKARNPSVS
jgi:hypothetical protein